MAELGNWKIRCEFLYHRTILEGVRQIAKHIQRQARNSYQLWKDDPYHPSLQFKQIHPGKPIFSTRIGIGWRAVGTRSNNEMIWFWIGSHEEYNSLIKKL